MILFLIQIEDDIIMNAIKKLTAQRRNTMINFITFLANFKCVDSSPVGTKWQCPRLHLCPKSRDGFMKMIKII